MTYIEGNIWRDRVTQLESEIALLRQTHAEEMERLKKRIAELENELKPLAGEKYPSKYRNTGGVLTNRVIIRNEKVK